jgi:PPOX class probable F420-dependent enzyme
MIFVHLRHLRAFRVPVLRGVFSMAQLDEKARAFLAERRFAVLATHNADGSIQQTVMWYDLDGDGILMNTAAGRVKEGNLRRDPRASVCVEDGYRFVTLSGTVQLDDDQAAAQEVIRRLALRYSDNPENIDAEMEQFRKQRRVTIRLKPDRIITRL